MSNSQMTTAAPSPTRYETGLEYFGIAIAVAMMVLGLRHWAVILGIVPGADGSFEAMSAAWKTVTMHMGVADLVASVGLWMRVAWGRVIWIYAAISEIALHTVFAGTFGSDIFTVVFHSATLVVFVALLALTRRWPIQ